MYDKCSVIGLAFYSRINFMYRKFNFPQILMTVDINNFNDPRLDNVIV